MIDTRNYRVLEKLKDGSAVMVRSIRVQDRKAIASGFGRTDPEAIYRRFFTYKKGLSETELGQLTDVDPEHVVALVVTPAAETRDELLGGGRYCAEQPLKTARTAELAFMTADQHHGRGIASLLLKHLVGIARSQALASLEAEVLAHNQAMLAVLRNSGLPMSQRADAGTVHVRLALA